MGRKVSYHKLCVDQVMEIILGPLF